MKTISDYSSIIEVVENFSDEVKNHVYLEETRWPEGKIICPHCWGEHSYRFKDKIRFKCKACRKIFNAKTGTMYEGTKLPLKKWFVAEYLMLAGSVGISSYELAKQLKTTQNTAWFLMTRIRAAIVKVESSNVELSGTVEIDEAWVGGKFENVHKKRKKKMNSWKDNKTLVLAMLQRRRRLKCVIIPDRSEQSIRPIVRQTVRNWSEVITDELSAYNTMNYWYVHNRVNHEAKVYAEGTTSTNGVENFWSHLKPSIIGVHRQTSKKHLNKYLQSSVFKYNTRDLNIQGRIELIHRHCDVRTKYKDLKNMA